MLQETNEKSNLQSKMRTIMIVLVALSLTLCTITLIYLLRDEDVSTEEALAFTIVSLVASIPMAVEIVTTTTLAIGSKELAKHGAIVTRLSAIEDLACMSVLCCDKTGTLTLNQMVLQKNTPVYVPGQTQESVLMHAAMAAKWEEPARDALDRLVLESTDLSSLQPYEQIDYMPFDSTLKRTEGTIRDKRSGTTFKTSKGAPHVMLDLLPESDVASREAIEKDMVQLGNMGIRALAVAKQESSGSWQMLGLLTL
jgi:H+-transporting ATPase